MNIGEQSIGAVKLQMAHILFHEVFDGVLIFGSSGEILDVNPAFTHLMGYSHADILGKQADFIQLHNSNFQFNTLLKGGDGSKDVWSGLVTVTTKKGGSSVVRLTINAVNFVKGIPSYFICCFNKNAMYQCNGLLR